MSDYLKYIVMLVLFVISTFAAHYLLQSTMQVAHFWEQTDYSLVGLYTFAGLSSLFSVVVIILTHWSMPKNLGFVFLGLITLKIIAGYIYINDGLGTFENKFIEYNFLGVIFMYLFFDVFIAFKALNQGDIFVAKEEKKF